MFGEFLMQKKKKKKNVSLEKRKAVKKMGTRIKTNLEEI